jgi:hypothetical protein
MTCGSITNFGSICNEIFSISLWLLACGAYCYKSLYTPHYVSPYNVGYVPHWTLGQLYIRRTMLVRIMSGMFRTGH